MNNIPELNAEEIQDLAEEYLLLLDEIIAKWREQDKFLQENPGHTMRAEVMIDTIKRITPINEKGGVILNLIDALEGN